MSEKKGIMNIIVVMDALIAIGMDVAEALEDKKLSWLEGVGLANNVPAVFGAINAATELPDEFRDLDDAERDHIVAHFAEKFDLPSDELEEKLERVFAIAIGLGAQVVEIVDLVKDWRD
jgi:hypothetical protein